MTNLIINFGTLPMIVLKYKGIGGAGSTADFRILFEIFETLKIFDFFETFKFYKN